MEYSSIVVAKVRATDVGSPKLGVPPNSLAHTRSPGVHKKMTKFRYDDRAIFLISEKNTPVFISGSSLTHNLQVMSEDLLHARLHSQVSQALPHTLQDQP